MEFMEIVSFYLTNCESYNGKVSTFSISNKADELTIYRPARFVP